MVQYLLKVYTKTENSQVLIIPRDDKVVFSGITTNWFDFELLRKEGNFVGKSKGRHITWFIKSQIKADDAPWVLRHYYRGGMISKITTDKFIYTGLENTRGFREVNLLLEMLEMNLPVPKPIGARINRKGIFYTADLLMEKIEAKDLVAKMSSSELSNTQWNGVGKVIADFHKAGIYHADLNAHNVMIDDMNKVYLIDFDRCEKRTVDTSWRCKNLERLKRSLLKEKGLIENFKFENENWLEFMKGYRSVIE